MWAAIFTLENFVKSLKNRTCSTSQKLEIYSLSHLSVLIAVETGRPLSLLSSATPRDMPQLMDSSPMVST